MVTVTPIPMIPTLDTQSILSDQRDIMSYVLRYYFTAPKSVSNTTYNYMISMADTASRYQYNPNTMVTQVTADLIKVYGNYFDPGTFSIDVQHSDNGDGSYNLTITMAVIQNNQTYTLGADVSVDSTGLLALKWHPNIN